MANKQLQYTYCPISHKVEALKFGQLVEYKRRNFFFQNHAENETGRLVPDLFLFFKKALNEVKANGLELSFNYF